MPDVSGALQIYARATDYIATAGLDREVAWQRDSDLASVSETMLLREAAWVILCSGFREFVVRRVFDHISLCFVIGIGCRDRRSLSCMPSGSSSVVHAPAKLSAIVEIARRVNVMGFNVFKSALVSDPLTTLRQFPYIGPITSWHLAKILVSTCQSLTAI